MPRKSQRELEAPPPVRLVEPVLPVELPAPPLHLSAEAADWWRLELALGFAGHGSPIRPTHPN